jgi:hypothetical protein
MDIMIEESLHTIDDLITRVLFGEATEEEVRVVALWLEESPENILLNFIYNWIL